MRSAWLLGNYSPSLEKQGQEVFLLVTSLESSCSAPFLPQGSGLRSHFPQGIRQGQQAWVLSVGPKCLGSAVPGKIF